MTARCESCGQRIPSPYWTEERTRAAHARHMAGEKVGSIALEAGKSCSSLSIAFKRHGLRGKRRPNGWRNAT